MNCHYRGDDKPVILLAAENTVRAAVLKKKKTINTVW